MADEKDTKTGLDEPGVSGITTLKNEDDSSSGDSNDPYSEKFDSLKALYSDKVCIPIPEAPEFDNISKFESVVLKGKNVKAISTKSQSKEAKKPTRKFLPHQLPIQGTNPERKQRFSQKNIMCRMERFLGPLGMLYQYMERRTKVKIYTRNERGIRGHLEAYIAAFDKHWNLALEDCYEVWTRKIKRKAPALGIPNSASTTNENFGPKVIVKERKGKYETLERHVPQLLLRGDQVVLVIKMVD